MLVRRVFCGHGGHGWLCGHGHVGVGPRFVFYAQSQNALLENGELARR